MRSGTYDVLPKTVGDSLPDRFPSKVTVNLDESSVTLYWGHTSETVAIEARAIRASFE